MLDCSQPLSATNRATDVEDLDYEQSFVER
jgi:hypothetical protein